MKETILSLEQKLNDAVDCELKKEVPDVDDCFVMACCDGLLRLGDTEKYVLSAHKVLANKSAILGKKAAARPGRRALRIILAAAIIALLLVVSAFGYAQVKYNML